MTRHAYLKCMTTKLISFPYFSGTIYYQVQCPIQMQPKIVSMKHLTNCWSVYYIKKKKNHN